MRHLVDVVMNKFHYFRCIIKSTRKCCDRFNTFPLYEKKPGWISRVSVTCPIKVWSAAAQADNAEKKIHLNNENGPISRVLQFYSSQPTTIAA